MKKTAQQIVIADNQQPPTDNRQLTTDNQPPTTGNRQPTTGKTWAGRAVLAGAAVWFANWVLSEGGAVWGSPTLKVVLDGLSLLALVPLIYLIYRATAWAMERVLWRLRRDLFVAHTAGLLEARNPAGEELGEERLLDWLNELRADAAETIKQNILQRVTAWTAQAEQEDDLTLLVWRKR